MNDGPFAKLAQLKFDNLQSDRIQGSRTNVNIFRFSTADPEDITWAMHCVGLRTREQIADFFGVHSELVRDWQNGRRKVPLSVAYTIALMAYHSDTPRTVEWLAGERNKPE